MKRVFLLIAVLLCLLGLPRSASGEPWPIDGVANLIDISWREGLHVSPDSQWLAYTVSLPDLLERIGEYSKTGVNLGSGANRRQARITNISSGKTLVLGDPKAFSWSPTWSPEGDRLAFFSNQGGRVQLWIHDLKTQESRAIPGVTPAGQFYFQRARWHISGQKLVVPNLGLDSALVPTAGKKSEAVDVRVANAPEKVQSVSHWRRLQPVIVDLSDDSIQRVGAPQYLRHYGFSPDGKSLVYCYYKKSQENSQGQVYTLRHFDLASEKDTLLVSELAMRYGSEWKWSPDSSMIAYLTPKRSGGQIGILYPRSGREGWQTQSGPNLDWTGGERTPLWSRASDQVYGCDGKKAYSLDLKTRKFQTIAQAEGWSFQGFFSQIEDQRGWPSGKQGYLVAAGPDSTTGLWRFSESGNDLKLLKTFPHRVSSAQYRTIVTPDQNRLVFYSYGVKNPGNIWVYQVAEDRISKIVEPNPHLKPEFFGQRKIIEWQRDDGKELQGVLLLPADYKGGPLPTVFWVYGGREGTHSKDTFGLGYSPVFNFEILASRGYAVFQPEIPTRVGQPMKDIQDAVFSGLDAVVGQGYTDPQRVAVMGQSYGSYTVLCLLVASDRFKAAVLTAAIVHPDLYTGFAYDPGYYMDGQGKIGATPWERPDLYRENSPFFTFDKITTPILIGQGSEDALHITKSIFNALESAKKDVELRVYDNESHVISKPANVEDFWQRRLEFLEQHLGKTQSE